MTERQKRHAEIGAAVVVGAIVLWYLLRGNASAAASGPAMEAAPSTPMIGIPPGVYNLSFQTPNFAVGENWPVGMIPLFGFIGVGSAWG